jgi:hypothetical protein
VQRVGLEARVGVGEDEQLAVRGGDARIERRDLAAALELEHLVGAGLARALRGGVGAAVAADDHLEALARPAQRERVRDLRAITAASLWAATISATVGSSRPCAGVARAGARRASTIRTSG